MKTYLALVALALLAACSAPASDAFCTSGGGCPTGMRCSDSVCVRGDCSLTSPGLCPSGMVCAPNGDMHVGSCAACGDTSEPCCATSTSAEASICNAGLRCFRGACAACGGVGQACCGGTQCGSGAACSGAQCVASNCATDPAVFCRPGSTCVTAGDGGSATASCAPCGLAGQACCPLDDGHNATRCALGLACDDATGQCGGGDAGGVVDDASRDAGADAP